MRARLKLAASALVVLMLFFETSLTADNTTEAGSNCAATYTVQRGDTLGRLAGRFESSVAELVRLNRRRIRNPDLIYVGQKLCLPVRPTNASVAIEAAYQFVPSNEESNWTLMARGGRIGRRVTYPLGQTIDSTEAVSTTAEVAARIASSPGPVLLGVRNPSDTYTLVAIGAERVLTSLILSDVHSLDTVFPPIPPEERKRLEQALGGPLEQKLSAEQLQALKDQCWGPRLATVLGGSQVITASTTIALQSDEGMFYPFPVTHLDFMPGVDKAVRCYSRKEIGFALFPANWEQAGRYRVVMVLNEAGIGPPGRELLRRCASWKRSGPWFRFMRAWYGCPR